MLVDLLGEHMRKAWSIFLLGWLACMSIAFAQRSRNLKNDEEEVMNALRRNEEKTNRIMVELEKRLNETEDNKPILKNTNNENVYITKEPTLHIIPKNKDYLDNKNNEGEFALKDNQKKINRNTIVSILCVVCFILFLFIQLGILRTIKIFNHKLEELNSDNINNTEDLKNDLSKVMEKIKTEEENTSNKIGAFFCDIRALQEKIVSELKINYKTVNTSRDSMFAKAIDVSERQHKDLTITMETMDKLQERLQVVIQVVQCAVKEHNKIENNMQVTATMMESIRCKMQDFMKSVQCEMQGYTERTNHDMRIAAETVANALQSVKDIQTKAIASVDEINQKVLASVDEINQKAMASIQEVDAKTEQINQASATLNSQMEGCRSREERLTRGAEGFGERLAELEKHITSLNGVAGGLSQLSQSLPLAVKAAELQQKLETANGIVKVKEEEVRKQTTEIQQQKTTIQQKESVIQNKDAEIQQRNTTIQQKDAEIQKQAVTIQQKDAEIQKQAGTIHQKDADILRLQNDLNSLYPACLMKNSEYKAKFDELYSDAQNGIEEAKVCMHSLVVIGDILSNTLSKSLMGLLLHLLWDFSRCFMIAQGRKDKYQSGEALKGLATWLVFFEEIAGGAFTLVLPQKGEKFDYTWMTTDNSSIRSVSIVESWAVFEMGAPLPRWKANVK